MLKKRGRCFACDCGARCPCGSVRNAAGSTDQSGRGSRSGRGSGSPSIPAIQRIAAATLASALSNRERSAIAWLLDQLGAHHGRPQLGGCEARPVEVVCINATQTSSGWVVDVDRANAEVRRVFPNRSFYDIEIHFPGTGLPPITGPFEEVQSGAAVSIDPHAPPHWARP